MEEMTAPLRVLSYEGDFRAWLSRCPLDPAEGQERLLDVYVGLLDPAVQALADDELRALVFTRLRRAVLDVLCNAPHVDRTAVERALPEIPPLGSPRDPARELQKSLERLTAEIQTLSPRCQRIRALHQFEQLTVAAIAARLHIEEAEVERELGVAVRACAAVAFSAPPSPPLARDMNQAEPAASTQRSLRRR